MQKTKHLNMADILIPARNQYSKTRALLERVYRQTDSPFHIFVLDYGSTDETVDLGKIYTRDITVVRACKSRSWAAAVNRGIRLASNPYIVILNSDVELAAGWLGNMILFLESHPRIAAVGPLESRPDHWQGVDQVRQKMVPQIPAFFTEDVHERNRILQYHFKNTGILVQQPLAFSCTVMTRRAVDRVGFLAESGRMEVDTEYCQRLRDAGYVLGLALDTYVRLPNGK